MRLGTYEFTCTFTSPALLPPYKGSTLRGGFGHALRKISCALRRQDCPNCLLFETCAHAFLFETSKVLPFEARNLRVAHRPHPYVIVPPDNDKRAYEAGERFTFKLILFGRANDYLPHTVYAVNAMGESGLGRQSRAPGTFALDQVSHEGDLIYEGRELRTDFPRRRLVLEQCPRQHADRLHLTCRTPLRLKHDNHLQDSLPFHLLVRAALRRLSTLEAVYGDGEPDLDYQGLVRRAREVEIEQDDCRWTDLERYSNRQRRGMKFGGLLGTIVFRGNGIDEFLPLLRYCQATHLGKQTSFGLGKIEIKPQREERE